jgi:hypothetical protein
MRHILFLAAGLAVGIIGSILFLQSMPPEEGSAEEKVVQLEADLKKAENRIAALRGADPEGRRRPGRTLADGTRSIAENIRDGKAVTPDDIFRATQPLLRDLSPIFERMRTKELQKQTDTIAGELARKYALSQAQQESLKKWLDQRAIDESKRYAALLSQKGTKTEDLAKAMMNVRLEDGLENFMASTISGEKLAKFRADQMMQKVDSVQSEADMKVERLDRIVNLDETQRGQIFGLMARGARDFDPAMRFEGLGTETAALSTGKSKQDAITSILRPDQLKA